MGDEGIKREIWDGKIPVCFKLDDEDTVMSFRGDRMAPEPCYVSHYLQSIDKNTMWKTVVVQTLVIKPYCEQHYCYGIWSCITA